MLTKAELDLPLPERQVRYSIAVRISMVLVAFFSAAWCMLQWSLTTEPRFMVEGITRQFVMLESFACAAAAAIAFVFVVANGLGWAATVIRMRREKNGAARKLAVQRSTQHLSAYI
jgi:hypothetical protein